MGVTSRKFLGFIITNKEFYIDPTKIKAIMEMQLPKTSKELRGLQGCLAYI